MLTSFKVFAVLPSSDLDRAKRWYEDHTGTMPAREDPGGLWYECADGTWFVITRSAYAGTAQNTAMSLQVTGIENVIAALRRQGVVFEDYDLPDFKTVDGLLAMGPFKAAWFRDGDGNIVELSEISAG